MDKITGYIILWNFFFSFLSGVMIIVVPLFCPLDHCPYSSLILLSSPPHSIFPLGSAKLWSENCKPVLGRY
jgi:hypothetical protein